MVVTKATEALGEVDYEQIFAALPVAIMVTRNRVIVACNSEFAEMFKTGADDLIGQSVRRLYPNQVSFERFGARVIPVLKRTGKVSEPRAMQRSDGEIFWVNVTGFTRHREDPYREAVWLFSEMRTSGADLTGVSKGNRMIADAKQAMTKRERDVAALLIQNQTAKQIGLLLGISPRTVEVFTAKLLKKFNAPSTRDLVRMLNE